MNACYLLTISDWSFVLVTRSASFQNFDRVTLCRGELPGVIKTRDFSLKNVAFQDVREN